ncbi:MAG TPA: hypothetical protein H9839_09175 [Candidatus Intestinimonas stercorigallinarum]|nr:hypothetical protein [Candidatus Intestinimonas stercorigallinarum]
MKKILLLGLSLALMFSLAACGKSEAATAVDEQIAAIGEVTLESEAAITEAEEAVDALAAEDREQLENVGQLEQARADYEALVLAAEAAEVEEAIAAIGTVTLDSAEAIDAARALYDGSDADVQGAVGNLADLEAAETALSDLRVEEVVGLIDAIGTVTLESAGAVDAAQDAFDALSDADAAKVGNADVLTAAAEQLKALKQEQAQALLANMRVEKDDVRGMAFYYPQNFPNYIDTRCYVLPYIGQEGDNVWLRLLCDYTEDDWVFFEQITFAVDDERYYKYYNYFDVVRDNDYGVVWEYVDTEVSDSDVEMLWAIANSTQTIVRFEGDEYYYDFTVSQGDKDAIREVLTAYEALQG